MSLPLKVNPLSKSAFFTVSTAGESHGPGLVAVVDGCPPQIPLSIEDLQVDLDRRKPGTSKFATQRKESDIVRILSGTFEGLTTGTAIGLFIENENVGFGDFLSSESDALDAFIERKLKEAGHSLSEENKVDVFLNPDNNHIIQRGQGAIVIP